MFSIAPFFNLPPLSRYRIGMGVGAAILFVANVARILFDDAQDIAQVTRVTAAVSLALFAIFGQKLAFVCDNPHRAVYLVAIPLFIHMLFMAYTTHLEPAQVFSFPICLAICCALLDSRTWLRAFILTWGFAFLTMVWMVDGPLITPPLTITLIMAPALVFLYMICGGFYAAQERLLRAERLLAESQSIAGVGGWEVNLQTGATLWTDTTYEILKMDPDAKHIADINHWIAETEDQADFRTAINRLLTTGESLDEIGKLRTGNGEEIWVHARAQTINENGKPVRAMGVFSDITKQIEHELTLTKAKEDAEEAALARSQFIANMSHEIRTPMNGVIGVTSLLAESDMNEECKRHVAVIRASGESLLTIVNDILDFSKLEAGKITLEQKPFNLDRLINSALDVIRHIAQEKGLSLSYCVAGGSSKNYRGDENRLQQVLVNLLSNAVKFTATGSIQLSVSTDSLNADTKTLTFSVADTGIGIAKNNQIHLFDAFTQEDASTTRKYGGTGLGLAICYEQVNNMDGEIYVESEKGHGATFTFKIPLPICTGVTQDIEQSGVIGNVTASNTLRILLAEDNVVNQKVALMMLNKLGHQVTVADNGREAVAAAEGEDFDVIFMDLQMPEVDGLEATRIIRANPKIHQPHIIALTANAMPEDKRQCQDAGMDHFVSKPMRLQDLQAALTNAVMPQGS